MEQYNDPKQVDILSESSNFLAPKKFYTSDLHIGHKNIIGFDHRPFSSLDEMTEKIIANWNKTFFLRTANNLVPIEVKSKNGKNEINENTYILR